jgi:hypothetical protein
MSGYAQDLLDLQEKLQPFIPERRLPMPRWIRTPDGDLGTEWCSDCGYYKVRNLRRHDRKRAEDYILDGGWRTEEEGFKFCCSCGVRLDVGLTDYGVEDAVSAFEECGFRIEPAEDAYELDEIIDAISYVSDRDTEEDQERRRVVAELTRQFLAGAGTA